MYTEFNHYLLLLTIFASSLLFLQPKRCILAARLQHQKLYWIISCFFLIVNFCFFGTLKSYASSDFTFYTILTNSSLRSPFFYKISATWSNHEGSLLLWCWLLCFYGFLFCILTRSSNRPWISSAHSIDADHFMTNLIIPQKNTNSKNFSKNKSE